MFLFLEFVRDGVVIKVQFFCVEREISGRVEEGWGVYAHMYTVKMYIVYTTSGRFSLNLIKYSHAYFFFLKVYMCTDFKINYKFWATTPR